MDIEVFPQMVAKKPDGFWGVGRLQRREFLEEVVESLRVAVQLDPVHVASKVRITFPSLFEVGEMV